MKGNESGTGRRRQRRVLLTALALWLAAAPAGLFAGRKSGASLRLELLDGSRLEGELLAVKGEALVLMSWSGGEARADIGDVAEVRIERGSRVGKGTLGGLAVGFALGALIALPATLDEGNEYSVLPLMMCGGLGGGAGALLGMVGGLISSGNDTIRLQGRDAAWRSAALSRLRRLARFREPAAGLAAPGRETTTGPLEHVLPAPAPRNGDFKRWRAAISFVQSPFSFTGAALDFAGKLRYGEPVAPGSTGSAEMSTDDAQRSWVGLRDVGIDCFLGRRWTIGVRLSPFPGSEGVYGRKTMRVSGQDTDASWYMHVTSRTYFLTASYALVNADGFLRRTALRVGAGVGWNRSSYDYQEYGYHENPTDYDDPARFNYGAWMEERGSTAISALVEAEVARYFNSRWSLALNGGFRYVPLRINGEELRGRIERRPPLGSSEFSIVVPGATLNMGGVYLGVRLGLHF